MGDSLIRSVLFIIGSIALTVVLIITLYLMYRFGIDLISISKFTWEKEYQ